MPAPTRGHPVTSNSARLEGEAAGSLIPAPSDPAEKRHKLLEQLTLAKEHVASGERHLANQRRVLDELARDGHNTKIARQLLHTLEETQALHISDRDRLERALQAAM